MFKPVTGKALDAFDEETQELYKKRDNDPRVSYILALAKRPERNHLPVVISNPQDNEYLVKAQKQHDGFARYTILLCIGFSKYNDLALSKHQH